MKVKSINCSYVILYLNIQQFNKRDDKLVFHESHLEQMQGSQISIRECSDIYNSKLKPLGTTRWDLCQGKRLALASTTKY